MRRLVVDAGTLLVGVAVQPHGTPALILAAVLDSEFEAVVCPHLIDEVRPGLASEHFRQRLREGQAEDIVAAISGAAIHLVDPDEPETVLSAPKDDYLVALARESEAEADVTGDRDLLEHPGLKRPAIGSRAACELLV